MNLPNVFQVGGAVAIAVGAWLLFSVGVAVLVAGFEAVVYGLALELSERRG